MTTTCKFCDAVASPGDRYPADDYVCQNCWYGGRVLARNMRSVIHTLNTVTGLEWFAEHTGGGCAAIIARDGKRSIWLTAWPDVMSLGSTISEVEACGWMIGAYPDHDDCETFRIWPDLDDTTPYGLHTEEVPWIARTALAWLNQQEGQR
jgi:hypothetical protein